MIIRRSPNLIDRVFEDWNRALNEVTSNNTLALDVHENEDGYHITTDIPGVNADDIVIQLHDNVLTIVAETNFDAQDEGVNTLLQERRYGKFSRSVRFPVNVNSEAIEANYENGVLTIDIPKAEEVKPRRITINNAK